MQKIADKIKLPWQFYYDYSLAAVIKLLLVIILATGLIGCATFNDDPWETYNRPIHKFNTRLDDVVLKPSAEFYRDITPQGFRDAINSFYDNLNEPYNAINSLLQGKFANAGKNIGRFLINSTIGIFGLFDVAGIDMGIKATKEDFGQTLGYWGVDTGPYLVLPFLGPGNLRDTITRFGVDRRFNTLSERFDGEGDAYYLMQFFHGVRARERLLDFEALSGGMSLDNYIFYRGIFSQNRLNQVYDGNPPRKEKVEEDDSWLDE